MVHRKSYSFSKYKSEKNLSYRIYDPIVKSHVLQTGFKNLDTHRVECECTLFLWTRVYIIILLLIILLF